MASQSSIFYIYSIGSSKHVNLYAVDPQGKKHVLDVERETDTTLYFDEILVRVQDDRVIKNIETSLTQFETDLGQCVATNRNQFANSLSQEVPDDAKFKSQPSVLDGTLRVDFVDLQPVLGFRHLRKDRIMRIRFTNLFHKWPLKKLFSTKEEPFVSKCTVGSWDLGFVELLHSQNHSENVFLHRSDLRIGTWVRLKGKSLLPAGRSKDGTLIRVRTSQSDMEAVDPKHLRPGEVLPDLPPLVVAYLSITVKSSLSTSTSQLAPKASIKEDEVTGWSVLLCTFGQDHGRALHSVSGAGKTEAYLLADLQRALEPAAVLTYFKSGFLNPIRYVHDRFCLTAKLFGSRHPPFAKRGLRAMDSGSRRHLSTEIFGQSVPLRITEGLIRLDMKEVLAKRPLRPPLSSTSPSDVIQHKNILKRTSDGQIDAGIRPLLADDPSGLDPQHLRVATNRFLFMLVRDCNTVLETMSIANKTDLGVTAVCENGQEKRIVALLSRDFFLQGYYINEVDRLQMTRHPVILFEGRAKSDFPDPLWHVNPSRKLFNHRNERQLHRTWNRLRDSKLALSDVPDPEQKSEESSELKPAASSGLLSSSLKRKRADGSESDQEDGAGKHKAPKLAGLPVNKLMQGLLAQKLLEKGKISATEHAKKMAATTNRGESKKTKKQFSGALVLEPVSGFFNGLLELIWTFDFASLYPSIMENFSICWTRVVVDRADLQRKDLRIVKIPIDETRSVPFVTHYLCPVEGVWKEVPAIMPGMIHKMQKNRKGCRKGQKLFVVGSFDWKRLEAEQLSWKILQNACYGFLGSDTSPLKYKYLGAVVCALGQWLLKKCRSWTMNRGALVIYGDTDSIMIMNPLDAEFDDFVDAQVKERALVPSSLDLAAVQDLAKEYLIQKSLRWEKAMTDMFRNEEDDRNVVVLELECVKLFALFLEGKKKTYAAVEVDPSMSALNAPEKGYLNIKGFGFTKRDRCSWVQTWVRRICEGLIVQKKPTAALLQIFQQSLQDLERMMAENDLAPLVITCNISEVYKSETCIGPWLQNMSRLKRGKDLAAGDRVPFVYADDKSRKTQESLQFKKAVLLDVFKEDARYVVDVKYYLRKQLLLSVTQLMGHDNTFVRDATMAVEAAVCKFEQKSNGQATLKSALKDKFKNRRQATGSERITKKPKLMSVERSS